MKNNIRKRLRSNRYVKHQRRGVENRVKRYRKRLEKRNKLLKRAGKLALRGLSSLVVP